MLPDIATGRRIGTMSGLGFGLSQIAGILALILVLIAFQLPGRVEASLISVSTLVRSGRCDIRDRTHFRTGRRYLASGFHDPTVRSDTGPPRNRHPWSGRRLRRGGPSARDARRPSASRQCHALSARPDALQRWHAWPCLRSVAWSPGLVLGWGALELAVFGIAVTLCAGFGGFAGAALDGALGSRRTIAISLAIVTLAALALVTFTPDRLFLFIEMSLRPDDAPVFSSTFGVGVHGHRLSVRAGDRTGHRIKPRADGPAWHLKANRRNSSDSMLCPGKRRLLLRHSPFAVVTELTGDRMLGLSVILVFLVAGFVLLLGVREE